MAGLGAGLRLSRSNNHEVILFERCTIPGGMAATLFQNDCILDYGVHGLFVSKPRSEKIVKEIRAMLGEELITVSKKTSIYFNRKYVNYPLQLKDLFSTLNPFQIARCSVDFAIVRLKKRLKFTFNEQSFKGWISSRFGKSLYDLYFGPYAEKVWGIPADTLDADPLVRRVTTVSLWAVLKKAIKKALGLSVEAKKEYSQQPITFLYGKEGAFSITRSMRDAIVDRGGSIQFGNTVTRINEENGIITGIEASDFKNTKSYECDYIISTIKINDLVAAMMPRPEDSVLCSAEKMLYRGLILVYLIIDRPKIYHDQWVYYSEANIIFNRVNEFKNISDTFAPHDKTALCAEITCFAGDELWNASDEIIVESTIKDLEKLEILQANDIIDSAVRKLPAVYPLYDLETVKHKKRVQEYISRIKNLYSIGRLGSFEYLNMDEVIGEGMVAAEKIIKEKN